jgi:penicillin-binding protein 1A
VLLKSISDVSPIMRQAIVSIEDRRFYEHNGVDVRGIARALWQDISRKKVVEGGSTITQQFVKNAYVRNQRSIGRKIREAALAWQLEQKWSKDRILLAYLNTIYFGNGAYGIQRAAQTYFGISASKLDLAQSALLAGLPADPTLYDPVTSPRSARERRHQVLVAMLDEGKITEAQLERADARALPKPEDVRLPGNLRAPYFVNYVTGQLVKKYGTRVVFGGGLRVKTTIDLPLQQSAREAIEKILPNPEGPAAALVAIDPRTGAVRAMFGGTNFRKSQFNLATQAERQPGSAFKPIVLATALRKGISPLTSFDSKPITIFTGDRYWHVTNYESDYAGRSNLTDAMVRSDNAVYAQLTRIVQPKNVVVTAHALGIQSHLDPFFSIGLGQLAVDPLDMARAYATFANDGKRVDGSEFKNQPRVVERVTYARSGHVKAVNDPITHTVLTAAESATLTSILQEVVTSGTGRRAALPDRAVAGKTGTTDKYGDAWFVGYTPQLAVAVWVGYPNELRPMTREFGGQPVAGGTLPALIWKEFMTRALKLLPDGEPEGFPFAPFLSVQERRIVYRGGTWKLANAYCRSTVPVVYFSGRAPEHDADCKPNEVSVPSVVGRRAESAVTRLAEQPLEAKLVYVRAKPRTRPGVVVRQEPASGGLSAHDTVTLFVTKAQYGLVPDLVGSSYADALVQLDKLKLRPVVTYGAGQRGTIVRQSLAPGTAVLPGLRINLVVAK